MKRKIEFIFTDIEFQIQKLFRKEKFFIDIVRV
jgi:hypothetical protein